jgi:hypothetical protein
MIKNSTLNKAGSVPANGKNIQNQTEVDNKDNQFPDYPTYPPKDDIYNKGTKVDLNPEDLSKIKESKEEPEKRNEIDFNKEMNSSDLDVPGAEFDDKQVSGGNEDEENNYYSLGGDRHNDLDEN